MSEITCTIEIRNPTNRNIIPRVHEKDRLRAGGTRKKVWTTSHELSHMENRARTNPTRMGAISFVFMSVSVERRDLLAFVRDSENKEWLKEISKRCGRTA